MLGLTLPNSQAPITIMMENLLPMLFLFLYISPFGFCLEMVEIKQITIPFEHGECPTWDERKEILYFIDQYGSTVNAYHYKTKKTKSVSVNGPISIVLTTLNDTDLLILGNGRELATLKWNGNKKRGIYKVITTVQPQFPNSRFNDGKADVNGHLWMGTMANEDGEHVPPNEGILYHITKENLYNPQAVLAPLNVSNGLTWNKDNTIFYFIDTPTRQIFKFDFNKKTGKIKNQSVAFDFNNYSFLTGNPDGMTIDEDDNLWVAVWGGGCIIKIHPKNGRLLQHIPMPAKYTTSVMWGGPNYDILYVTTSRRLLTKEEKVMQPLSGAVFAIKGLSTRGRPVYYANVL